MHFPLIDKTTTMLRRILILPLLALLCSFNTYNILVVPSNFYFKINNGANDSYNSETTLFKRCYIDGNKSYEILLSEDDKKEIYDLYKEIHFLDFPNKFEIDWNDKDTIILALPCFFTSIEICDNDSCKKVVLNLINLENPINDKEKALQYKKLYDMIWQIIKNKPEYKDIPNSDCIYL